MAEECHKINELILSVYGHFGFDRIVRDSPPVPRDGWGPTPCGITPRQ